MTPATQQDLLEFLTAASNWCGYIPGACDDACLEHLQPLWAGQHATSPSDIVDSRPAQQRVWWRLWDFVRR
jgi:hypothetical protein